MIETKIKSLENKLKACQENESEREALEKQLKNYQNQHQELAKLNGKILKQLSNYQLYNQVLNEIFLNKKYNNSIKEFKRNQLLEHIPKARKMKIQLIIYQEDLISKNITNDFLINNFQLELTLKKFWYRFYSKFFPNEIKISNYWRNEFLDCYKKQFFLKKKFIENDNRLSQLDINEINQDLRNDSINSSLKVNTFSI